MCVTCWLFFLPQCKYLADVDVNPCKHSTAQWFDSIDSIWAIDFSSRVIIGDRRWRNDGGLNRGIEANKMLSRNVDTEMDGNITVDWCRSHAVTIGMCCQFADEVLAIHTSGTSPHSILPRKSDYLDAIAQQANSWLLRLWFQRCHLPHIGSRWKMRSAESAAATRRESRKKSLFGSQTTNFYLQIKIDVKDILLIKKLTQIHTYGSGRQSTWRIDPH